MIRSTFLLAACLAILPFAAFAGEQQHWTYEGDMGPDHWGELAPEFDICASGRNQSPIDLVADLDAELPELRFDYSHMGHLIEANTGHAIQETVRSGNYLTIKGDRYELKQFHFHSPSEHLVNGESLPMEVHLVHQNESGQYAVIGLLFVEGERNEILDQMPSFRRERGEDPNAGEPVDMNALIPDRRDYFFYNGALTTPPCTEGVHWAVFKQPIVVAPEQIQHYHDLLGFDNNRPIQPHNARVILD